MSRKRPPQAATAAFEIRFSATDSQGLEVFEIQSDQTSEERVPDPFKKRDKIPRHSGSIMNFEQNTINNNNNNTIAPLRHSSTDSPTKLIKQKSIKHHLGVDNNLNNGHLKKGISTISNGIDQTKSKSSNAVGPEADKSPQRANVNGKNSNVDKIHSLGGNNNNSSNDMGMISNSTLERKNLSEDDSVIRSAQSSSKKRPFKVEENASEKEKSNSGKETPKYQIMDLNGKVEKVLSNHHKKNTQKNTLKNKKINMPTPTNNYKDEEIKSLPGIATPPETPPRSPPMTPNNLPIHSDDDGLITPRTLEEPLITPPLSSSSGSAKFNVDDNSTTQSTSPKLPQVLTKSRIPRLSVSSRERPVIAKKASQKSLSSQGSNESNKSDELRESPSAKSSHSATLKLQPPNVPRLSTSKPIINTTISYAKVESESPTSLTPTKKLIIPHDEVIIPTVAKKLKMNGKLPFANHDALLGYSEESENISPTTENGYMDVTDQVVDLFDGSQNKTHKRQPSVPDSQRRQKKSTRNHSSAGHSRNSSNTHYIAPRKQNLQQPAQHIHEGLSSPKITQFEDSSNPSSHVEHTALHDDIKRERKSRREEYIMLVVDDDDDEDAEITEPRSSMSLSPSEPSTAPTTEVESREEEFLDNKVDEKVDEIINPSFAQVPVAQIEYYPHSVEVASNPVPTNGKKKKGKKNKKQKKGSGDLDEEDMYVRKSRCRCMIQ